MLLMVQLPEVVIAGEQVKAVDSEHLQTHNVVHGQTCVNHRTLRFHVLDGVDVMAGGRPHKFLYTSN